MIKWLSRSAIFCFPNHRSFWFSGRNIFPASQTSTTDIGRVFSGIRGSSASVSSSSSAVAENEVKVLNGIHDNYGGVVVTMNKPMDSQSFASMLKTSISHWRQQGKRGVWIKLPIYLANLFEPAVKFDFAHENFFGYIAGAARILVPPRGTNVFDASILDSWGSNTLPANASHRVCIGAFVMNEKREVLVVQENSLRFRGGGYMEVPYWSC